MPAPLGKTLVVTALTADRALLDRLPGVRRSSIG